MHEEVGKYSDWNIDEQRCSKYLEWMLDDSSDTGTERAIKKC